MTPITGLPSTPSDAVMAGALPPLPAQPLYVDPPEARLPQGGLRPAPVA